jgi:competence protein ComEC
VQRTLASVASRIHAPAAGEVITLGHLRFRVLSPPPRAPGWTATGDPNDSALVARLEAAGISMLLTADAESPVIAPLHPASVDVLKVSHHGSADPGLPALLTRLRPRIAAIEVGRHNPYGHPAPATIAALKAAVATVVRTDRDGTVRLHVLHGRLWLERGADR